MNIILKKGKEFSFFKTCYIYKFAKVNNSKLPRKSFYNKYIFYHRLSLFNYLLYSKKSILKRKYHHTALYKPILYLNKLIFDILIAILFVFTLYKILEYGINKYANKNTIIKKVTNILRNVLENNETHELLAKLILNEFVRNKSTEKKMSKLFAKILRQDNINKKLDILLKKIIIDYLRSEECFQELKKLIINEVLRNEDIKKDLYLQLHLLVSVKEFKLFEEKFTTILLSVLKIPSVQAHFYKKILEEIHTILKDDKMIILLKNTLFIHPT